MVDGVKLRELSVRSNGGDSPAVLLVSRLWNMSYDFMEKGESGSVEGE